MTSFLTLHGIDNHKTISSLSTEIYDAFPLTIFFISHHVLFHLLTPLSPPQFNKKIFTLKWKRRRWKYKNNGQFNAFLYTIHTTPLYKGSVIEKEWMYIFLTSKFILLRFTCETWHSPLKIFFCISCSKRRAITCNFNMNV